jgi:hypothetical protein
LMLNCSCGIPWGQVPDPLNIEPNFSGIHHQTKSNLKLMRSIVIISNSIIFSNFKRHAFS